MSGRRDSNPRLAAWKAAALPTELLPRDKTYLKKSVGADGFEPPKVLPADLQSAPFGHSGMLPLRASRGTRTPDQLITNQLLYQLSYTG